MKSARPNSFVLGITAAAVAIAGCKKESTNQSTLTTEQNVMKTQEDTRDKYTLWQDTNPDGSVDTILLNDNEQKIEETYDGIWMTLVEIDEKDQESFDKFVNAISGETILFMMKKLQQDQRNNLWEFIESKISSEEKEKSFADFESLRSYDNDSPEDKQRKLLDRFKVVVRDVESLTTDEKKELLLMMKEYGRSLK